MTQVSAPQNGILVGDAAVVAPYDANEWGLIWSKINGFAARADYGVAQGYDNGVNFSLEVTQVAIASTNVELKVGSALVTGTLYWTDATVTLPIGANASGNPRIDTVVLRKDYVAQTVRAVVLQGTPAGSPVPPTLTQSAGATWEIPLADIAVANGFSTITDSNITPRHQFVNVGNGTFIDNVLNSSGITLQDGDVVIWNNGTARSVTTTTTPNHWRVAGVWRGRTANGGRGRLQTRGFGKVRVRVQNTSGVGSASLTISSPLVTGALAACATTVDYRSASATLVGAAGYGTSMATIGLLMEATTILNGATFNGLLLAYIDVQQHINPAKLTLKAKGTANAGTFTSGSWVARTFTDFSDGSTPDGSSFFSNYVGTADAVTYTLQPGRYFIRGFAAGYRVDGHLMRLQNTTAATTVVVSTPAYSPSAADSSQTFAEFETFLVVESAANFQFQQRCTTTRATDGLGKYVGFAAESVTFAYVEINRLDDVLP